MDPFLYHITWYRSLPGIATRGLVASGGEGIAPRGSSYATYSSGRIFATEREGIPFWYGRAEDHAQDRTDDPFKDGFTPVVLRFPRPRRMALDEIGSEDARADAYILERARIAPALIEVWNGRRWSGVARGQWRRVDSRQAYRFEKEDGETLAWFREDHDNPLVPPVPGRILGQRT